MGDTAWVSGSGIDVILNTRCTQSFSPTTVSDSGLDPETRKGIVAKSTNHLYAGYAPIAKGVVYVNSPGTLNPNFTAVPHTELRRPLWPMVVGTFGGSDEAI